MNNKITLLVAAAALMLNTACSSPDESQAEKKSIRDLVLIYNGGKFRTVTWDKQHTSQPITRLRRAPSGSLTGSYFWRLATIAREVSPKTTEQTDVAKWSGLTLSTSGSHLG